MCRFLHDISKIVVVMMVRCVCETATSTSKRALPTPEQWRYLRYTLKGTLDKNSLYEIRCHRKLIEGVDTFSFCRDVVGNEHGRFTENSLVMNKGQYLPGV